ncbi:hypothetical protein AUCHE_05_03630 [Austwickia chelonae NBRC 105200]|uniref:Uncharacterized protein n=1 Tax=Austwickia chelonae NBRC 105200 TaxID=1184607 RepID=K6ULQ3_9MICO|nr:hypothetical protein AUCHE_05_03630 [Austwickia chelonae NBRC 105200]
MVTALCVVDGWLTLVGDLEDLWFTVGDLASFWSTDLMLLEMIFAAKIPAVERLFTEGSARTRRSFGAGSLIALMVCVLATVAGYTQEEPETLWLNVVDTVMGLPLTLVVMVVALAVVSTIAVITTVRRRSVQEIQDLIGRWVFPVCLLMVPFDLWVDADLLSSPWTNAYWWTLWLVTVVVSVVFRGGVSEAPGAVAGPARGRGARAERPGPQEMFALRPRPTNTPSG